MSREKIFNSIGFALLAICFVVSLGRVFMRSKREADPNQVKIRFAHWQLEGGVRGAFNELAREYEALHPGVTVEQMAIPEKIAKNWARTQLVGGTAPDLIQLGYVMGTDDEVMARYFEVVTEAVEEPNPYNAGTELEKTAWRDTFIDGLSGQPNYSETLLSYFGIPSSMFTVRMYYNKDLWRQIAGSGEVPKTYEEFIAVCRKAAAYDSPGGHRVIAIAGSKYNAPFVMNALFASQTQKLKQQISPLHDLATSFTELAFSYLEGGWSWQTPAVATGLDLMMRTGKFMQPGFLSLGRDDALFYFAQERALMIATGSWDSSSLAIQVPFKIGVFTIPLPAPDHPDYGQFVYGQVSEAGVETGLSFGLTSESEHPAVALDFLKFLTSKQSNETFSRISGWLPAVVGVDTPESIAPFEPVTEGYVDGFAPAFGIGADTKRIIDNNLHLLVGPNGSLAGFTEVVTRQFSQAIKSDLTRAHASKGRNAAEKDSAIGAYQVISADGGAQPAADKKINELVESQNQQETETYFMNYKMKLLGIE